jgi:acetylornithine deacetylase
MTDGTATSLAAGLETAVREAVERRRDDLVELLRSLVRQPSTLGAEAGAQDVVEQWLREAGFEVERVVPDAEAALADPSAGYPYLPYEGRSSVVGRLAGTGGGSALHLNGHVDVVPVERPDLWEHEPWSGEIADGRLWGRGAGDMKGGLAAYLVAAAAIAETCDDRRGDLLCSSVIEEECGGNGMWSVLRAGYEADAVLVGEPTGLHLGHAYTGVVWARLISPGGTGHAMLAGGEGAFDRLGRAVAGLRKVESAINEPVRDPIFAAVRERPYGMTIGRIEGGVWTASTPHELVAQVRFGFGRETDPAEIQGRMRAAVAEASPEVEIRFEGFRARAYAHPTTGPLVDAVSAAHRTANGSEPEFMAFTATTDARYVEGPCLCYGPIAGNLHGTDEWVDVESLVQTATVAALATAAWTA